VNSRTVEILNHFEKLAPTYSKYRKRFNYYWKDIVHYCNYFIHEEQSVIEIGCGNGDTLSQLKGTMKTGIDLSPAMIREAKQKHPDLDFRVMNAENLYIDEKYDVIVLSNVVGYLDNVLNVLNSMRNICHDNTKIILNTYNYFWEPFLNFAENIGLKKKSPRQNWLSKTDITNLLFIAGFESYRYTRRILLPMYIPLVSSFINKFIGRLPIFNNLCLNQFVFARLLEKEEKKQCSVSIVIPARNEQGNIEDAIIRMPAFGSRQEIIFIEGGSKDDTWKRIQEIKEKYSDREIKIDQQKGKGKGDAVRLGFDIATGDILMILDADLTVPPEDLKLFYEALASGKGDFINGSRLVYPMEKGAMRFLNQLGNKFFSIMFSWMLEQPIKDTLCGTKVIFKHDYLKLLKNRSFFGDFDPFGDFDLIFGAYKLNLKIIDLPIRYRERVYGTTNISRFSHGFLLLKMVAYAARKIKFR